MPTPFSRIAIAGALSLMACLGACGTEKAKPKPQGRSYGHVELSFIKAAQDSQIPVRILLAVGMTESSLTPNKQSASYPGLVLGSSLTETAFGVSRKKLGFKEGEGDTLQVQVDAYAKWVRANFDAKKIALKPSPASPAEMYDWIWQLAQLHRDSQGDRRNVRILFAMELIERLNKGDMWQDPETGEILTLPKEPNPITVEKLTAEIQQTMTLTTEEGPFPTARYFEPTIIRADDRKNKPTHIRVIHCPLSLSACLEIQNPTQEEDKIRLGAHYVIPSEYSISADLAISKKVLQVAQHKDVLEITNNQGNPESVQDAIVVMLVGDSGHYVAGKRVVANPKWFTDEQLKKLGIVVKNVCSLIKVMNPDVDVNKCLTPGIPGGVRFLHQDRSEQYQWGDIPDFTESIFYAYIRNPQGLPGSAVFEFPDATKIYGAGQSIPFRVRFLTGAASVAVDRADRCLDGRIIWTNVQTVDVIRNSNSQPFEIMRYYKGPNGNGQHFLRTMVYNVDNSLAGWAIDSFYLRGYDKESGPGPSLEHCSLGPQ